MLELFFQEIIFNLVENNFFLIPGWIESTIFVMNTYVNVAFLRLLLSVVQLAKTDQHLEEELMFCAQANPLSQWGTYLPWINLLLHTSVWFTCDRLDVCLDVGDLLYGPQLLLSGERSGYLYCIKNTGDCIRNTEADTTNVEHLQIVRNVIDTTAKTICWLIIGYCKHV